MIELFDSVIPDYFKPSTDISLVDATIQYGFNSDIEFKVSDDLGSQTRYRKGAYTSNQVSLYGKFTAQLDDDEPILDGIRKDIIDTSGAIDFDLVNTVLMKSGVRRDGVGQIAEYFVDTMNSKNVVSPIYNALRLFYSMKFKGIEYDRNSNYYNNGHVKILNKQILGENIPNGRLKPKVDITSCINEMSDGPAETISLDTPVFNWRGRLKLRHKAVLDRMFGPWTYDSAFGIAHKSPALADEVYIRCKGQDLDDPTDSTPYSLADIKETLEIFVDANKLYTDFSYAYAMLTQVMVTPKPRSAEATAWIIGGGTITMPRVHYNAGAVPMMLQTVLYAKQDNWRDNWLNWLRSPAMAVWHSIGLVEAAYIELGNVARSVNSDYINHANFVDVSSDGQALTSGGLVSDLTLLAMRYGIEIDIPYNTRAGLDRLNALSDTVDVSCEVVITDEQADKYYNLDEDSYQVRKLGAFGNIITQKQDGMVSVDFENLQDRYGYTSVNEGFVVTANLKVKQLPPALYPIFSFGIRPDAYYAAYNMADITINIDHVHGERLRFYKPDEFTKYMNIMRIAGWDVTATEITTQRKVTNWADNASGRFIYTDAGYVGIPSFEVNPAEAIRRDKYWVEMKDLYGQVTLSYSMKDKRAKILNGRSRNNVLRGTRIRTVQSTKYSEAVSNIMHTDNSLKLRPIEVKQLPDFRFTRLVLPGLPTVTGTISRAQVTQNLVGEQADNPEILPDMDTVIGDEEVN